MHPQQGESYDLQYDDGESDAGMRLSDVGHPDNFTDEDEDEEVDVEVDEESPSEQQEGMPGEAPEEHTDILSAPEEENNKESARRAKHRAKKKAQKARRRGRGGSEKTIAPGVNTARAKVAGTTDRGAAAAVSAAQFGRKSARRLRHDAASATTPGQRLCSLRLKLLDHVTGPFSVPPASMQTTWRHTNA